MKCMSRKAIKPKTKMKKSAGDRIFDIINYTIFGIFTLICIYPFYYMFINTISDNRLVDAGKVMFYPMGIHFQNYLDVLEIPDIGRATLVSLIRTVLGTLFSTVCTAYMAYFFTKQNMWKRKFWYRFCIVTMYFGAGLIPGYLNLRDLHLLNTFWVYIIPGLISIYNMVLVKTYIESIPAELEESAELDGAGYLTRFFKIVMPLCTPILATIALWSAVGNWNSFMDTLLYITDSKYYTLQYLLQMYFREAANLAQQMQNGATIVNPATALTPTSVKLTVTVIVTVPILCVYPFVQRFFVKGIMVGSVKG